MGQIWDTFMQIMREKHNRRQKGNLRMILTFNLLGVVNYCRVFKTEDLKFLGSNPVPVRVRLRAIKSHRQSAL